MFIEKRKLRDQRLYDAHDIIYQLESKYRIKTTHYTSIKIY
jgi:hypothetical protein